MGLCIGKTSARSPWPELPPDLAGLVLCRLPSLADRLSFRAVCRNWRLLANQQGRLLPPALPLINLGPGRYQTIADPDRKLYIRRFAESGCRTRVSFGSWLLFERSDHHRLFLRDLNLSQASTDKIVIPCCYTDHECTDGSCCAAAAAAGHGTSTTRPLVTGLVTSYQKIVVCSPDHRLLAAIMHTGRDGTDVSFAVSRQGTDSWSICASDYRDIIYHHGKIFALSYNEELLTHDPAQPCRIEQIIDEWPATAAAAGDASEYFRVNNHLVVSSDGRKLLMVRWSIPSRNDGINHGMKLQVFEADLETGEWAEVKDLGGQVLFLSRACSRALGSSSTEHLVDESCWGGNRVFILGVDWAWRRLGAARCCRYCKRIADGVPGYCVYNMASGEVEFVLLKGGYRMENPRSEWFFPELFIEHD
ncbi:hypothetical protein BRADI_1g54465v3 [Brachypodium distachyon]|uniref:F-box domain-containing protein n=1 Tax=Brachypodium distachyon TaxID=15368 RepID=A0A2K2DRD9_BRADI|nr:hypothetical protein BRADI_1g54465v3 [Brachypodium distachyon]